MIDRSVVPGSADDSDGFSDGSVSYSMTTARQQVIV